MKPKHNVQHFAQVGRQIFWDALFYWCVHFFCCCNKLQWFIICFSRIKLIFKTSEDHTIAKLKSTSETSRKCLMWPCTNFPLLFLSILSTYTSNKGAFLGISMKFRWAGVGGISYTIQDISLFAGISHDIMSFCTGIVGYIKTDYFFIIIIYRYMLSPQKTWILWLLELLGSFDI